MAANDIQASPELPRQPRDTEPLQVYTPVDGKEATDPAHSRSAYLGQWRKACRQVPDAVEAGNNSEELMDLLSDIKRRWSLYAEAHRRYLDVGELSERRAEKFVNHHKVYQQDHADSVRMLNAVISINERRETYRSSPARSESSLREREALRQQREADQRELDRMKQRVRELQLEKQRLEGRKTPPERRDSFDLFGIQGRKQAREAVTSSLPAREPASRTNVREMIRHSWRDVAEVVRTPPRSQQDDETRPKHALTAAEGVVRLQSESTVERRRSTRELEQYLDTYQPTTDLNEEDEREKRYWEAESRAARDHGVVESSVPSSPGYDLSEAQQRVIRQDREQAEQRVQSRREPEKQPTDPPQRAETRGEVAPRTNFSQQPAVEMRSEAPRPAQERRLWPGQALPTFAAAPSQPSALPPTSLSQPFVVPEARQFPGGWLPGQTPPWVPPSEQKRPQMPLPPSQPSFVAAPQPASAPSATTLDQFAEAMLRTQLPSPQVMTFDGDVRHWAAFITSFTTQIASRVQDPAVKLSYLIQFCLGDARECIKDCVLYPPEFGYNKALETLSGRYGSKHQMAASYLQDIKHGPKINANDPDALQQFAVSLDTTQIVLSQLSYASEINSSETILQCVKRLPYHLSNKWVETSAKITLEEWRDPAFADFVVFVKNHARVANTYMARELAKVNADRWKKENGTSKAKDAAKRGSKHQEPESKPKVTTMTTSKTKNKEKTVATASDEGSVKPRFKCPCCETDSHSLVDCRRFGIASLDEKTKIIQRAGLCFRCLRRGHMAKDCDKMCDKCGKRHHTLIHDPAREKPSTTQDASVNVATVRELTARSNVLRADKEKKSCFQAIKDKGVHLGIIPITAYNLNGLVKTFAMVDSGSEITLMKKSLFDRLQIAPTEKVKFSVNTMAGVAEVGCQSRGEINIISGDINNRQEVVCTVTTVPEIPIGIKDTEKVVDKWPHLREVPPIAKDTPGEVEILFGTDCPDMQHARNEKRPVDGVKGPFARETKLGWCVIGPDITPAEALREVETTVACVRVRVQSSPPAIRSPQVKKPSEKLTKDTAEPSSKQVTRPQPSAQPRDSSPKPRGPPPGAGPYARFAFQPMDRPPRKPPSSAPEKSVCPTAPKQSPRSPSSSRPPSVTSKPLQIVSTASSSQETPSPDNDSARIKSARPPQRRRGRPNKRKRDRARCQAATGQESSVRNEYKSPASEIRCQDRVPRCKTCPETTAGRLESSNESVRAMIQRVQVAIDRHEASNRTKMKKFRVSGPSRGRKPEI